ncbi:MAG: hypothetical protein JXL80_11130 [Planctomycetes bacterium]|nr:hypothetical protein [Planctomycetota bacterium]
MLSFRCPNCGKKVQCDDHLAGKRGRCPACNQKTLIPVLLEKTRHEEMLPGAEDLQLLKHGHRLEIVEEEEDEEPFWASWQINKPLAIAGILAAVALLALLGAYLFYGKG